MIKLINKFVKCYFLTKLIKINTNEIYNSTNSNKILVASASDKGLEIK